MSRKKTKDGILWAYWCCAVETASIVVAQVGRNKCKRRKTNVGAMRTADDAISLQVPCAGGRESGGERQAMKARRGTAALNVGDA